MRHAFRPHYIEKRIDLKILLKVNQNENAFTPYLRGRSKTLKSYRNEIDDRNIAAAFVVSTRILEFMNHLRHEHFYGFRTFACVQSETHRNAGSSMHAN